MCASEATEMCFSLRRAESPSGIETQAILFPSLVASGLWDALNPHRGLKQEQHDILGRRAVLWDALNPHRGLKRIAPQAARNRLLRTLGRAESSSGIEIRR